MKRSEHMTFDTPAAAVRFQLVPRPAAAAAEKIGNPMEGSDQLPMLQGYAIVWNVLSSARVDKYTGEIYFAKMLPGSAKFDNPTLAIYSHDAKQVLGNTGNGTLRVLPDDTGARVEIDLPPTTYARDIAALVKGQYVQGMSFGMVPLQWSDSQEAGGDGQPITVRSYSQMLVDEVTVTPIPAFIQTSIAAMYARDRHAIELDQLALGMIHL